MAQHDLKKSEAKILSHIQKVKTTYETDLMIAEKVGLCSKTVKNGLAELKRLGLLTKRDDEGQRLLEITELGKKHLVILEELKVSRWG